MAAKQEAFQEACGAHLSYSGPIIKKNDFNPKPVAGKIPYLADSLLNINCVGTRLHQEWWEEQFYRMQNGYTTGGLFLPPVYYQYLNFDKIEGLQGEIYPDFIDTHYSLYLIDHEIKKYNIAGIVIPKGRRKGISLFGVSKAKHGMRWIESYRMGLAAGLDGYVTGFRNKLYNTYNKVPPELQVGHLAKNYKEFILGWEEASKTGWEKVATAICAFRTMKDDATKMEGEYFHDVFAEESGQFPNVEDFIDSVRPTMDLGAQTKGTIYVWGSAGEMAKASKGFKNIWFQAESFGFIRFPILGKFYFYPHYVGSKDDSGNYTTESNEIQQRFVSQGYEPNQVIGCQDLDQAEADIKAERARLAKNPDKRLLVKWNQKYPLTVEEIFASSGSNNFDNDLLYSQAYQIETSNNEPKKVVLEWVKDEMGMIVMPMKVTYRPPKPTDKDWQIVDMLREPFPEIRDLDVGGIDGYNEDQTNTSNSLGCMNIVRQFDKYKIISEEVQLFPLRGNAIICQYYKRPPRKELFFEICLQLSVLYNLVKNTMISAESDMVIQYYKQMAAHKYLSERPKTFDAPNSELLHDYGAKMTNYSKPRMVGLLQSWVLDNINYCWFLRTVQDLISYDTENIGTDYDSADALGLALMRIIDMRKIPRPQNDVDTEKMYEMPRYKLTDNGIVENSESEYQRMIRELFFPESS